MDPDPRIRFVKQQIRIGSGSGIYQLLFYFFSMKNIFPRNMICFVIHGVNIYVSKHKFQSLEEEKNV